MSGHVLWSMKKDGTRGQGQFTGKKFIFSRLPKSTLERLFLWSPILQHYDPGPNELGKWPIDWPLHASHSIEEASLFDDGQ